MRNRFPFIGLYRSAMRRLRQRKLDADARYWDARYEAGGNSGAGSFGKLAVYKADFLNRFVRKHSVESVLEFGCGDGNQLALYDFPAYVGLDVSPVAVAICRRRFRQDMSKRFEEFRTTPGFCRERNLSAQLTISVDVIFHLTDDRIYFAYLGELFGAAREYVIVYASNCTAAAPAIHVRHRPFVDDVGRLFPQWKLITVEANPYPFTGDSTSGSFADFHIFELDTTVRPARPIEPMPTR